MSGRFSLTTSAKVLQSFFCLLEDTPLFEPRNNIAPLQQVAAIRCDTNQRRKLAVLCWGIIPYWSKDANIDRRMLNARAETLTQKTVFRAIFRKRRCLIPADGFYEWRKDGRKKQPFHIHMRDNKPFAFAGLWDNWQGPDGVSIETCTIITTDSNTLIRPIRRRMPAILNPGEYGAWLDPSLKDPDCLSPMLRPYPVADMEIRAINDYITIPRNEGNRCFEEYSLSKNRPVGLCKAS